LRRTPLIDAVSDLIFKQPIASRYCNDFDSRDISRHSRGATRPNFANVVLERRKADVPSAAEPCPHGGAEADIAAFLYRSIRTPPGSTGDRDGREMAAATKNGTSIRPPAENA
jgi:hypothetical protein